MIRKPVSNDEMYRLIEAEETSDTVRGLLRELAWRREAAEYFEHLEGAPCGHDCGCIYCLIRENLHWRELRYEPDCHCSWISGYSVARHSGGFSRVADRTGARIAACCLGWACAGHRIGDHVAAREAHSRR